MTAKLICVPSPSLAGWGLIPYISSFLAMSKSCTSESPGVFPLGKRKEKVSHWLWTPHSLEEFR